jgi:RNA polymerase sigma-70 factor (ECF subfamily)
MSLSALLWFCVALIEDYRRKEGDAELIELARGGDHEAFQVLVERHQAWMLRFVSSLVPSKADAEELAQNVFLRAFINLRKFRGESSFRTWLRTIAVRQSFDFFRRQHPDGDDDALTDLTSNQHDGVAALEAREAVRRALEHVPYVYREILVLRYIEDMELDEIAAALDLGGSATRMRLSRAREYFRQAYSSITY